MTNANSNDTIFQKKNKGDAKLMQLYIMMGVLLTLMQNGKMTAQQLAEKFEVSTRSIYRYVDSLSVNGVPIVTDSGRKGGIYLINNFNLDNMFFTTNELMQIKDFLAKTDTPESVSLLEKVNYLLTTTPNV